MEKLRLTHKLKLEYERSSSQQMKSHFFIPFRTLDDIQIIIYNIYIYVEFCG